MQTFGRLVSGPRCVERSHNRWVAARAGEIHRQGVTSIYPRPSTHWLQGVGWRGVPTFTKAMVSLETRPPPIDTTRTRAHPVPQDRNRLDHEPARTNSTRHGTSAQHPSELTSAPPTALESTSTAAVSAVSTLANAAHRLADG